ncbi:hypothetical protein C8Q78DRAFT_965008 [Trametes maxima]|nr:hypothetical protein C8Q78DRAFT_965008 [Trametes maxima]
MANGAIVESLGKWIGTVDFKGIQVQGTFEIMPSNGVWTFFIGKTLLKTL